MRFEELNWFDIDEYLQREDRLILVIGSCEQHGYLSLLTDVKIPAALADAASEKTGVLVAPALNFGCSPYFLGFPGTLSLRVSTLLDAVEDIVKSAFQSGFRRILVMNGHGGNEPARARLYELINSLVGLRIAWYSWWQSHSVQQISEKYNLKGSHANWIETYPFTKVADLPAGEKLPAYISDLPNSEQARQYYGDGVFGGPYSVDVEIMEEVFTAALKDVELLLNFE